MNNLDNKFKVFGRKKGRRKKINFDKDLFKIYEFTENSNLKNKKLILDIGFGFGENTIHLAKQHPNKIIIASDVFEDGTMHLIESINQNYLKNVKILNQNVYILFDKMNLEVCFEEIWLLFPDPWPKNRHYKRRLINSNFLKKIAHYLKQDGKLHIATDSTNYFVSILESIAESKVFEWINFKGKEWNYLNYNLPLTKFCLKALKANKTPKYMILTKI